MHRDVENTKHKLKLKQNRSKIRSGTLKTGTAAAFRRSFMRFLGTLRCLPLAAILGFALGAGEKVEGR